jgi:hypothetical protein
MDCKNDYTKQGNEQNERKVISHCLNSVQIYLETSNEKYANLIKVSNFQIKCTNGATFSLHNL